MDIEHLIGTMIKGSLTTRRKRSRGAGRFLTGGGGSFMNASTLLTVGGLIWGAIETMQQQKTGPAPGPAPGPVPPPPGPGPVPSRPVASPVPPPVPSGPGAAPVPADLPPLPVAGGTETAAVPEGALRIIRLMISAARADGNLTPEEKESIVEASRGAGAQADVVRELNQPTPLASIVEGVSDARQRADLYVLAYGIVRGDETVTGAERIYLAQLAALLGLDRATTERLEAEAAARIDEQPVTEA
jgi:hypothetical protein